MTDGVSRCPLCNRRIKDFLRHLSILHEIGSIEEFNAKLREIERVQQRQKEFSEFVGSLKTQISKGLLSTEDYRKLIIEWDKQH